MKFYVSAKWQLKEAVAAMQQRIRKAGHRITADWTTRAFKRDYETFEGSKKYAEEEVQAILESDILIHLSDLGGKGKYVDLGVGLAGRTIQGKPKIYVLGEKADESQFYYHPDIQRITGKPLETLEKILQEIEEEKHPR